MADDGTVTGHETSVPAAATLVANTSPLPKTLYVTSPVKTFPSYVSDGISKDTIPEREPFSKETDRFSGPEGAPSRASGSGI